VTSDWHGVETCFLLLFVLSWEEALALFFGILVKATIALVVHGMY
jgi:hypothetical protein